MRLLLNASVKCKGDRPFVYLPWLACLPSITTGFHNQQVQICPRLSVLSLISESYFKSYVVITRIFSKAVANLAGSALGVA